MTPVADIATVLFICIMVAGCASPSHNVALPYQNVTPNITLMDDFPIHISMDGWFGINSTGTVVKNLSEIVANNYTDIPNFVKIKNYSGCGYSPKYNYSNVANVALHDNHIRTVLRDNGTIYGMYVGGPSMYTYEMSKNACNYVCATFEFRYQGKNYIALINDTTREVILDDKLIQNLTEKFG